MNSTWVARLPVYALFLVSGGTALVYQVTWLRDLSLIFGASFRATSIVLASFMAGLALGGFAFGRAYRFRRPLALYGLLEIGIAVFALALPMLLGRIEDFYVATALEAGEVTLFLSATRIVLAFGVLVLPTFFMGASLPVLIRAIVRDNRDFGTRVAWLYGVNTLGAAIGALSAGFILIPRLGVAATEHAAVIVNLAIGTVAILIDLIFGKPRAEIAEEPEYVEDSGAPSAGVLPTRLAFYGTVVAGMSSLALEVMWTRAISLTVGNTTYSFTVMLVAFLVGIWIGSWIHAALPLRRIPESVQFGVVLLAAGISSIYVSQSITQLPEFVVALNVRLFGNVERLYTSTALLASFAVMLVPSIFFGLAFPLATQARARLARTLDSGVPVGDTVGLNTLGAIAGSLLSGFVVIPTLGLQKGMLVAGSLAGAYGLMVLGAAISERRAGSRWILPASVALAFGLVLGVPNLAPRWDISLLGSFSNNALHRYFKGGRIAVREPNREVVYFEEGRSATVSVVDVSGKDAMRAININGKTVASDGVQDVATQIMLGHVPMMLHPNPKTALVVGLGAGVTLGAVSTHPEIEELAVVEIEPVVLGGAALFSHVNEDVLNDPRLEVVIQDGRNYLKTTSRRFDVITADPIHPWTAGASYLFTVEYYKLAAQRLNEGGVMCQWVPLYEFSEENFRSIVRSFDEGFEHVMVWSTLNDVALIGSNEPLRMDMATLAARIERPRIKAQLEWAALDDPVSFLSRLAAEDLGVSAFGRDAILNTDDNLYIEFSSPLAIGKPCALHRQCGLAAYYPGAMKAVSSWAPLFDSADAGRAAVREHRARHPHGGQLGTPPRPRDAAPTPSR